MGYRSHLTFVHGKLLMQSKALLHVQMQAQVRKHELKPKHGEACEHARAGHDRKLPQHELILGTHQCLFFRFGKTKMSQL
eukprot:282354-Pelagomonas_calceolata.AAC.5